MYFRRDIVMIQRAAAVLFCAVLMFPSALNSGERWWRVFFTVPGCGPGRCGGVVNPETGLGGLIRGCRESFDGAFYELSSPVIAGLLIDARRRGVRVRLVMERGRMGSLWVRRIMDAGIPVVADDGEGLMHNKFAVIDGRVVWTGSYNPTVNGAMRNNNNALAVESTVLSEIFTREFMEMFDSRVFGNRRERGVFAPFMRRGTALVHGTVIRAMFSPEDEIADVLREIIRNARESVRFMAFSFTSNELGEELVRCRERGVDVSGIIERKGSVTRYSEYVKMLLEGVKVKRDCNRFAMHHKVFIIDGRIVVMGSYNFSRGAQLSNDENVLVIENTEIAREYLNEFDRLYAATCRR